MLYIQLAKAFEAGDLRAGFREMALNVYPVILMVLHRLGLDWETAAALWGVTISSLVVLPLWGWVRRQFDDRVALVACLLYIVHPKFIEWSPEVMRDQTFWFLFMLAIYWLWRAVTEVRYGYFIAAGAAITLASVTRIEGLFLLIPLVLWTFWRWLALRDRAAEAARRRRSCASWFSRRCLALVNVAWLYGHAGWVGIRLSPLARVQPWLEWLLGHGPAAERRLRSAAAHRPDDLGVLSDDDAGPVAGVRAVDVRRDLGLASRLDPPRLPSIGLYVNLSAHTPKRWPSRQPNSAPTALSTAATTPITTAGYQMEVLRKARLSPTASASMLVATAEHQQVPAPGGVLGRAPESSRNDSQIILAPMMKSRPKAIQ